MYFGPDAPDIEGVVSQWAIQLFSTRFLGRDATMISGTDTVGSTFKRAFHRVDGVTMYIFWAIWIVISICTAFDAEASKIEVMAKLTIGFLSPLFFVMLGIWRAPGLLSALIIAGMNIKFLLAFF